MHEHVNKRVKMHKEPIGGTNKHGKRIITWSRKGKRYSRSNRHYGDASQVVTSKQGLIGVGCNHTTTNPLRASSVAKPRTKEANTSIKHRSKQASIDMQIGVIQTLLCGPWCMKDDKDHMV